MTHPFRANCIVFHGFCEIKDVINISLQLKIFLCVSNIKDVTSVKMFPTALQQYKFSRTPPVYDLLLCKAFLKFLEILLNHQTLHICNFLYLLSYTENRIFKWFPVLPRNFSIKNKNNPQKEGYLFKDK